MEEIESVEAGFAFDISYIGEDGPLRVVTHDYSEDWSSDAVSTPGPSNRAIASGVRAYEPAREPADLQRYSKCFIENEDNDQTEAGISTFPELFASISKRPADDERTSTSDSSTYISIANVHLPVNSP